MDEILEHLGIILLIVISVAAKIVRTAKKASKSEAAPSIETAEPAYGEIIGKKVYIPKVEKQVAAAPVPTKKQKKAVRSSGMNAESNAAGYIANEKSNKKSFGFERSDSQAAVSVSGADFDLRKAVIYSEILTPKFKEE